MIGSTLRDNEAAKMQNRMGLGGAYADDVISAVVCGLSFSRTGDICCCGGASFCGRGGATSGSRGGALATGGGAIC